MLSFESHLVMNMFEQRENKTWEIQQLALDGSKWTDSSSGHFDLAETAPGTKQMCGWMGLRTNTNVLLILN
jgi:hypothetical protein